jgi:hypothetical protein
MRPKEEVQFGMERERGKKTEKNWQSFDAVL